MNEYLKKDHEMINVHGTISLKQVKAVDSEYMEGLQKDSEKISSIMTSLLQPDHPYFGFSCGNRESLVVNPKKQNVDVLAELRKFYDKYYSANLMCLCVSQMFLGSRLSLSTKRIPLAINNITN